MSFRQHARTALDAARRGDQQTISIALCDLLDIDGGLSDAMLWWVGAWATEIGVTPGTKVPHMDALLAGQAPAVVWAATFAKAVIEQDKPTLTTLMDGMDQAAVFGDNVLALLGLCAGSINGHQQLRAKAVWN